MNKLEIFNNEQFGEIRTVQINNEVWFVGKYVASALGYVNTKDAIKRHVDEEDKQDGVVIPDPIGRDQTPTIINESGLYSLILSSKLPTAKEFKRWITSEVLPSIRKNGGYISNQENLTQEEILANALLVAQNVINEKERLNKELELKNSQLLVDNAIMKPKADYFDDLVDRNLLTNFTDTATMLKVKRKDLITYLLDNKFLYRNKQGKLVPYASKNKNLFEIKESKNDKTEWTGVQTLVTPKGRETFRLLMLMV